MAQLSDGPGSVAAAGPAIPAGQIAALPEAPAPDAPSRALTGALTIGLAAEPLTLHPLLAATADDAIVTSALFANCTRETSRFTWVAEMCESVPTLENGGATWVGAGSQRHLEVTFHLRPGWQWQDGRPVTAQDYLFTWRLALDPALALPDRAPWEKIQDMVAPDDRTLVVLYHSEATLAAAAEGQGSFPGLKEQYAALRDGLPPGPVIDAAYYALGTPLPAHILAGSRDPAAANAAFGREPVGNGAYRLAAWQPGQAIELAANPTFSLGQAKIQRLILRPQVDGVAALALLRQGELDLIAQDGLLDTRVGTEADALAAAGVKLYLTPTLRWEHVDLNVDRFPFNDVRLRLALAYATDRQALAGQALGGQTLPAGSFIPDSHPAYATLPAARHEYSLLKARTLLNDAGWDCRALPCSRQTADGQTQILEFTLLTTDRPGRARLAQLLARQWSQAGFGVNVRLLYGRNLFLDAAGGGPLASRTFDAALFSWDLPSDMQVAGIYACQSIPTRGNGYLGQNYSGWCNQSVNDQLLQLADLPAQQIDGAQGRSILAAVQAAWAEDVPAVSLFHTAALAAARADLLGFSPTPLPNSPDLRNAWQWELAR